VSQEAFIDLGLVHLHVAAITTHTEAKKNSFGVQLHDYLNIDHLYCVKHHIQLTTRLVFDDKQYGFDVVFNHCELVQK
jgi:hypothetical protein